jgi:LAO/AO transport system kinase
MGGLSRAVGDGIHVMDVMGKDKIIVETVGVGQQEVDIINHAHTIIVVQVPGMGDEIQAIKAGLMEIADIFVINKADRDGAGKLYREIQNMLDMGDFTDKWRPRILKIESIQDPHKFSDSVMELTETVDQHYQYLIEHNDLATRQKRKIVAELNDAMRATILDPIINHLHAHGVLEEMVNKLVQKETDPYSIAEEVARKYMDAEFNHQFAD